MKFWGAEVKPGKPEKVAPEKDTRIHISQASLDCKGKMTESVLLTVTVDGKKHVIGTLSQDKFPQISFDLNFDREFELSHNCTKGSVHFVGYRSPNINDQEEEEDFLGSEEEEEEAAPEPVAAANGTGAAAASTVVKAETKPKDKLEEDESDDSSGEEDESDEDDDSEKGVDIDEDDSVDSDDESEEEEETPQNTAMSTLSRCEWNRNHVLIAFSCACAIPNNFDAVVYCNGLTFFRALPGSMPVSPLLLIHDWSEFQVHVQLDCPVCRHGYAFILHGGKVDRQFIATKQ